MTRLITTTAMVLVTLALAACGEDETAPTSAGAPATAAAGDPERYCALTREMDTAGTKFFARLERKHGKEEPTAEDYEAAERAFVQRFATQFEAIEEAAPAEIRDDIEILLAGQRQRAGLGGSLDQAQVSAAERRVRRYERRHCG
jgi:hypothetical protein